MSTFANTQLGSSEALAVRREQFIAMTFGVAILGSVLNSSYRSELGPHLAGLPAPRKRPRAEASPPRRRCHTCSPPPAAPTQAAWPT